MTESRCWECNNMFPSFGYQTLCSACYQTRKVMESLENRPRPVQQPIIVQAPSPQPLFVYIPDKSDWPEYIPPTPEEEQKKKELIRLDKLFSLLVIFSIPIVWAILWMITSGWVTFFTFIAALYTPFYLHKKHFYWQVKNAKYLYQI